MLGIVIAASLWGALPGDTQPCGLLQVAPTGPALHFYEGDPLRTTVYLNFQGEELRNPVTFFSGDDNSAEGLSILIDGARALFPPYAGSERTAVAAAQAAAADLAPFGVRVVFEERPSRRLPYTMVMMGGDASLVGSEIAFGGFAPIDCEVRNLRHIVYVFNDEDTALEQANIIGQEVAHAWGLDHTLGDDDLMSYSGQGLDKAFTAECRDYCTTECLDQAIFCQERHEEFCPAGQQNAVAELLHLFGSDAPDTESPQAEFVMPVDGEVFDVGDDIAIEAEITDDFAGFGWGLRIERDGEVLYDEPDYSGVPRWFLRNAEQGRHRFVLTVEDHADHITTVEVAVAVGDVGGTSTGDGAETSGDSSSSSSSSSGAPEAGSSEASGMLVPLDDDGGCTCRAPSRRAPPWILLMLLAPQLRRRRPSRPSRTT